MEKISQEDFAALCAATGESRFDKIFRVTKSIRLVLADTIPLYEGSIWLGPDELIVYELEPGLYGVWDPVDPQLGGTGRCDFHTLKPKELEALAELKYIEFLEAPS